MQQRCSIAATVMCCLKQSSNIPAIILQQSCNDPAKVQPSCNNAAILQQSSIHCVHNVPAYPATRFPTTLRADVRTSGHTVGAAHVAGNTPCTHTPYAHAPTHTHSPHLVPAPVD
eukprot:366551-Chlamydomonas_euryale.AAC.25